MQNLKTRVGMRIRMARKQRGLTQEDVAERASVNITYYGKIERGEANVSLDLLEAVAASIETSVERLVGGHAAPDPDDMLVLIIGDMLRLAASDVKRLYCLYQAIFPESEVDRRDKGAVRPEVGKKLLEQWRKAAGTENRP